ncbi:hypothetical protein Ptr902_00994 [Pyrenophora tritici-repentis]|nr:hypothetical protein Ptr902_00994 [Pyrenophora tritici-repentis]
MDTDITALIEEATRAGATGASYTVRIGLVRSLKKKDTGVLAAFNLWCATRDKVHQIAGQYKTRNSIKAALEARPSLFYDITNNLRDYGPKIWNDGVKDGKFVTKVNKPKYPKHLVFKNRKDQHIIRKHLFGWVVQRACRTSEEWGRTGPRKRKHNTPPTQPRVAKAVVIRRPNRQGRQVASFPDIDDDSMDELGDLVDPEAKKPRRNPPTRMANVNLPPSTKKTRMALSNAHDQRSEEGVRKEALLTDPLTSRVAPAPAVKKRGRPRSTNKVDTNPQPPRRQKKQKDQFTIVHSESEINGTIQKPNSSTDQERDVQPPPSDHSQHERECLDSIILLLLERHDPGTHDIEELQQTIVLTTKISQNDSQRLRTILGHAYEACQKALDRFLTCLKEIVAFRQMTNFTGDATTRAAFCAQTLTTEQKKSARGSLTHLKRKKAEWVAESNFSEGFSRNLALLLLEMISWGDIPMSFPEMQEYLLRFNESLLAWF